LEVLASVTGSGEIDWEILDGPASEVGIGLIP
jgi:hypothetical protein